MRGIFKIGAEATSQAETIRVKGLVQGVGFRPTVWRLAHACGLVGDVRNDGDGVLIRVAPGQVAEPAAIDRFCERLLLECPPLARIDDVERQSCPEGTLGPGFEIVASAPTAVRTGVVPDAATCQACVAEIGDPQDRRYGYAFTNCTHCGPRLSILRGIPYDRPSTSMSVFEMCPDCRAEYEDPADRRFHAQPNACPVCGPKVWLVDADGVEGRLGAGGAGDAIARASRLLAEGAILAIKGVGGFHLACDACNGATVAELRRRKRRYAKPLALMARDLDVVSRYCELGELEIEALQSPSAPIVLLERLVDLEPAPALATPIAPGQNTLGFMLPYSPLHHLLLRDWDRPLVMTSGNLSEEPQCIDNLDAARRLGAIADYSLIHDRDILNRLDDSVVRVMAGELRMLRRARGVAPAGIRLPQGFADAPAVVALGGELKNTICLLRDGWATLSQHLGDLEDALTAREQERTLKLYLDLFQHQPEVLAVDLHPDYRSTLLGREWAERESLPLVNVQHHHAHLASVLADADRPLSAPPVLGILLDGLGLGDDNTIWGGEFLIGDYRAYRRVAHLKPAPMPGGTQAILEPWRNLFARLEQAGGFEVFLKRHPSIPPLRELSLKQIGVLRAALARGLNAPFSSSAGRLFDAVGAALGLVGERISYEGQAAIELEALAVRARRRGSPSATAYAFAEYLDSSTDALVLDPHPIWEPLLCDLAAGIPDEQVALGFHKALAGAAVAVAVQVAEREGIETVALSGGVFQNKLLLEGISSGLRTAGLEVLMHRQVPANDGGLSLGQACVAAARTL